jgi:transcriptional regulator with XRE-family HTH domain
VSTNLTIRQQLFEKFRSRKRRRAFAELDLGSTVAAQVYALRKKHDYSQKQLADETEMSQARISVLENPNYRKFNVGTLQRIAAAFDVALIVRFVSFGELLDWTVTGSQKTLTPLSFDEEFGAEVTGDFRTSKGQVISLFDTSKEKRGTVSPMMLPVQTGELLGDQGDVPIDALAARQGLLEPQRMGIGSQG